MQLQGTERTCSLKLELRGRCLRNLLRTYSQLESSGDSAKIISASFARMQVRSSSSSRIGSWVYWRPWLGRVISGSSVVNLWSVIDPRDSPWANGPWGLPWNRKLDHLVGTKTEMCRGTISKVGLLTYRTFESAFTETFSRYSKLRSLTFFQVTEACTGETNGSINLRIFSLLSYFWWSPWPRLSRLAYNSVWDCQVKSNRQKKHRNNIWPSSAVDCPIIRNVFRCVCGRIFKGNMGVVWCRCLGGCPTIVSQHPSLHERYHNVRTFLLIFDIIVSLVFDVSESAIFKSTTISWSLA